MKKLTGFVLAAAFAVTAAAPVQAQTVAELQAQIQALMAQLAAVSGTGSTSTASYNFQADLTIGSEGADVVALQTALESKGFLTIPAGTSKGYFGALTQQALAKYQTSVGISPASGYFGPITRAHFNSMTSTPTTPTTPGTSTPDSGLTGGEASLEQFDLSSEDDAEEGAMKHIATAEFDVEDGDVQINRVDVTFEFAGAGTADDEPWDVFETITLMIDGEEVAEEDLDDEDNWLDDNSPFVFRTTDIDYVAEEGETVEIEIYLTAQSNVDDTANADWEIYIDNEGIRAVDSEGIQNYTGATADVVAFDIDEEGGDESIEIKSSSNDPDAATLLVDDNDDSEWHEVFIFKLEAEENDIELDELVINVAVDDDSDATTTYAEIINDIVIEIDGQEFDDYTVANTAATTNTNVTFDIDGDFTVDADEEVEVVVMVEFNKFTGNYTDGGDTSIIVSTVSVDGEGVDDVTDTATVTGEEHVLNSAVAEVSDVSSDVKVDDPNDSGVISFEFTVTADEDDVTFAVVNNANVNGTTDGVLFDLIGTDTTIATAQLTKISGDATYGAGEWSINEGDDATFVLDVTFTTVDANDDGVYRVRLDSVAGTSVDQTSAGLNLSF